MTLLGTPRSLKWHINEVIALNCIRKYVKTILAPNSSWKETFFAHDWINQIAVYDEW